MSAAAGPIGACLEIGDTLNLRREGAPGHRNPVRSENFGRYGLRAPGKGVESPQRNTMSDSPKITCYLKTYCGWSEGVRAIMRKYDLSFEEKDIIENPAFRWEMEQKSGQPLSPCVEINGEMLVDVSGEEVEAWMVEKGMVAANEVEPDAPIDSSCSPEQHEAQARAKAEAQPEGASGKIVFLD